MKLVLACVGKLRAAAVRTLCEDYAGRLARYGSFELHECKDARASSAADAAAEEGARLRALAKPGDAIWVLDERGVQVDSPGLAKRLSELENRGVKRLVVLLGGAHGLDEATRQAGTLWSLSKLTLPHELCRVLALEQLYRARTIQRGEPYHH